MTRSEKETRMSNKKNANKSTPKPAAKKNPAPVAARAVSAATPALAPSATRVSTMEAKPANKQGVDSHRIAEAAYFLWLKRGGNEVVNWLEAEASLRNGVKTS
jgi:hypothetical protein